MKAIIKLLENKNYWLKKYVACNEAYLQALRHAPELAVEELELFYGNRESLLKIMAGIDKELQAKVDAADAAGSAANSGDKTKINFQIREKDSMLSRIIDLDAEIIGLLDKIKEENQKMLGNLNRTKKALAKYKSTNKYNEKLDEKA